MDLTFDTPLSAQHQSPDISRSGALHDTPTWATFSRQKALDDTLPSPPSVNWPDALPSASRDDDAAAGDTAFYGRDRTRAAPHDRSSTATPPDQRGKPLPPPVPSPPPPPPPPPSSAHISGEAAPSSLRTPLRTLAAAESGSQLNSSAHGENTKAPRATTTEEGKKSHRHLPANALDGAAPTVEKEGLAVLAALQQRCLDLARHAEALESRAAHRERQHARTVEAQRDEADHALSGLQQTLAHAHTELQTAQAQNAALQEEKQKLTAERRQHREQIARLERQHQQDAAKMATLTTTHAKDTEALQADLRRVREERDDLRQKRREDRERARKGATVPEASSALPDTAHDAALDVLRHDRHLAEERAVLAEQAFDALREAWLAASASLCGSAPSTSLASTTTAAAAASALLDEAAVLSRLQTLADSHGTDTPPTLAPATHLSNGATLRLLQYREAVRELHAHFGESWAQYESRLSTVVQDGLAVLESSGQAQSVHMLAQLARLAQRVEAVSARVSTRGSSFGEHQQERRTRAHTLRESLAAAEAQLAEAVHVGRLLRAQLHGAEAAEARRHQDPATLVPIMAQAAEAVRTARLSMARTVDELLARVAHVAGAEAGQSMTNAFLVVMQTTAAKAEAQVELLARAVMGCATTHSAPDGHTTATAAHGPRPSPVSLDNQGGRRRAGDASPSLRHSHDTHPDTSIPLGADGFPVSLTTPHQRDVYAEMQRLLRTPPVAVPGGGPRTAYSSALVQLENPPWTVSMDTLPSEAFCPAHEREFTALTQVARQLRNMSTLLDNHKAQTAQQHERIAALLQDWHWTMESSMRDITDTLAALLTEAAERQSLADRATLSVRDVPPHSPSDNIRVSAPADDELRHRRRRHADVASTTGLVTQARTATDHLPLSSSSRPRPSSATPAATRPSTTDNGLTRSPRYDASSDPRSARDIHVVSVMASSSSRSPCSGGRRPCDGAEVECGGVVTPSGLSPAMSRRLGLHRHGELAALPSPSSRPARAWCALDSLQTALHAETPPSCYPDARQSPSETSGALRFRH